jgi:hypothetical protein
MANAARQATWEIYQNAWADITDVERKELLSRSLADNISFSSLTSEGQGLAKMIANIENFQKQFHGATFRTHKYYEHHDQLLAEWMMYDKNGAELLAGKSFARFDANENLVFLSGFWDA